MRSLDILSPVAICALLAAPEAGAQSAPFPMTVTATHADQVELLPNGARMRELAALEAVRLTGVPLPGGGTTALELRRVALHLHGDAIRVDGERWRGRLDASFSLWRGSVAGQPGSDAFLAFSEHGSRGWFGMPGDFRHLLAQPGVTGWQTTTARIVSEAFVQSQGVRREFGCEVLQPDDPIAVPPVRNGNQGGNQGGSDPLGGPLPFYDAPIAFETDYEFYALFNDLPAARSYALALIGAVSDRYREQNGVIFTIPYLGFHTTNTDPWTSTQCQTRLSEFRTAWRDGRAPVRAQLYHMISGVRVSGCGGVAYLNVICNQSSGFGMSAHINTNLPFPPVQGPLTWDFMVLAHELGHQFGSNHTHSYSPPIDGCASGDCSVVPNGTIMSYCHTCPGGMSNINLMFHPRVQAVIRATIVASCLQRFNGILSADAGRALAGSNGTPVQTVGYISPIVNVGVTSAPRNQPGAVFFGFRADNAPFLGGGVLVPRPDIAIPVNADAAGNAGYSFPVAQSFPAGITVWKHAWFFDAGGPNGWAASNATRVELIRP